MEARERQLFDARMRLDIAEAAISEVLELEPRDAELRRLRRDVRAQRDRVSAAILDRKLERAELADAGRRGHG